MKNNYPDSLTIQLYLEGKLDAQTAHRLEKQALDDPFLWEALEGYESNKTAASELSLLQRQLHERIVHLQENKKVFDLTWQRLSVAATASVLFITAGILFWMNINRSDQADSNKDKQVEVALIDRDSVDAVIKEHEPQIAAVPNQTTVAPDITVSPENNRPVIRPKAEQAGNQTLAEAVSPSEVRPERAEASNARTLSAAKSISATSSVPAEPKGGWQAFREYIDKNAKSSPEGVKNAGAVLLSARIDNTGKLAEIKVIRGLDEFYNTEAIRLLKEGPEWIQGSDESQSEVLVEVNFSK